MKGIVPIFFLFVFCIKSNAQQNNVAILDTSNEAFFSDENRELLIFYRAKQNEFSRFKGPIKCDTADAYTFIQFDTSRVYFQFPNVASAYSSFFTSGLLSIHMIYCKLDKNCMPIGIPSRYNEKMELVQEHFGSWYGDYLMIYNFTEPDYLKVDKTKRRFKIQIHNNANYSYFFLECENPFAREAESIEMFLRNAKLTVFEYGWSKI